MKPRFSPSVVAKNHCEKTKKEVVTKSNYRSKERKKGNDIYKDLMNDIPGILQILFR
jgi:hypothetical protein